MKQSCKTKLVAGAGALAFLMFSATETEAVVAPPVYSGGPTLPFSPGVYYEVVPVPGYTNLLLPNGQEVEIETYQCNFANFLSSSQYVPLGTLTIQTQPNGSVPWNEVDSVGQKLAAENLQPVSGKIQTVQFEGQTTTDIIEPPCPAGPNVNGYAWCNPLPSP
jgi:hypothetical protein